MQGSGDDHELWANVGISFFCTISGSNSGQGLTPALYWQYRTELLERGREGLPALMEQVVKRKSAILEDEAVQIGNTRLLLHCSSLDPPCKLDGLLLVSGEEGSAEERSCEGVFALPAGRRGTSLLFQKMPTLVRRLEEKMKTQDVTLGSSSALGKDGQGAMIALALILLGELDINGAKFGDSLLCSRDAG